MISLDMVLYSITVVIFAYPLIAIINYIFNKETILIWQNISYEFIQNISIGSCLIIILIYAVIPAICEEFFFRGILSKLFRKYNLLPRILVISLIFAIMHYSLKNFIGPFLLSVFLVYICDRSDSIIPAIIGHFVYNFMGLSVVLLFYKLNSTNVVYMPKIDLQVFSFLIIIIAILLVYPVYKIIDIIESKHRLKVRIRENSDEISGQISILDYYGKK
ncbi:CPBP family glutamic-type intramembrane protease [Microaceticoccus formicicus]|uniref:CPBP family glutamic-type intramembrane protease n=1 Tax=Microaceticoccus formicicus TaxID=3118105 RepID=UPI003CD002AD|nr:CPBP family intramembrane glutamic endopeptidase [Peptoniphilaceae bacterium AMB_02]